MTLSGGCHCGNVRFEVDAALPLELLECNCSMCARTAFMHLIIGADDFRLIRGEAALCEYRFGTGAARHLFCRRCGIKSYYVPRSHPDGYSINARCLDDFASLETSIKPFDGQNWDTARARLG